MYGTRVCLVGLLAYMVYGWRVRLACITYGWQARRTVGMYGGAYGARLACTVAADGQIA